MRRALRTSIRHRIAVLEPEPLPHPAKPAQAARFGFFLFAYYGYVGIFTPYISLFFAGRGLTATQIGILLSLVQAMRIVGPNLWGWVADHTQRRVTVLRMTALAASVSATGFFFGQSFAQLLVVMIALNGFTSAQGPLSEALMLSDMRGDMTHYGPVRLWGSVGFIALVTLGGPMLDWAGIDSLPWMVLAMLVMTWAASMRIREAPQVPAHCDAPSVGALLRRREVRAFFLSCFLMIAAHAALYVFYSLYLEQIGYSKTVIGLMWSLGVIAEIVFFFYQAPVFRRAGVRRLMIASLLLAALRFLMIGFGAQSLALLLVAQVLHAASFGVHHSAAVATLQRWFSGPLQARGQALYVSISYGLGGTAGGLILSALWDKFGAQLVYVTAAAFALLGAAAAAMSYRWQPLIEETK